MKYRKIIRKWAKLRHPDKKFGDIAIKMYENSDARDKVLILEEFTQYIDGVRDGIIVPGMPKLNIPVFKKETKDDKTEKYLKDYYNGK